MYCNFLTMGNTLQSSGQEEGTMNSPLQLRLINFLGLKNYFIERFIFRRCIPKYSIRHEDGENTLYLSGQQYFSRPNYTTLVDIIQYGKHSVPVFKLTPTETSSKDLYTIIYAHGNASDLYQSVCYVDCLSTTIHAQFICFDYSGYGESRVKNVGQEIICGDLELVMAWSGRPMNRIILWGFSLGTYPMVRNAEKYQVKGLILQCPIASVSCLFHKELPLNVKFKEDYFANLEHIAQFDGHVLIIHSTGDQIIPFAQARLLYDKLTAKEKNQHIRLLQIGKHGHNALHRYIAGPESNPLRQEIFSFLKQTIADEQNILSDISILRELKKLIKSADISSFAAEMYETREASKKMSENCFCFSQ